MRTAYEGQLAMIERSILGDLDLAIATLVDVSEVVADTSRPTPGSIERNAQRLRESSRESDEQLITTIACQSPVAGDLRLTLVLMEITHHLGLIANQFDLLTAELLEIDLDTEDCLGTGQKLAQMARLAGVQLTDAASSLTRRDAQLARELARSDQDINRLNRGVFATALSGTDDPRMRETALHQVLIARSLERIGDNAVDIAEQVAFLATGEYREFTDASRPKRRR